MHGSELLNIKHLIVNIYIFDDSIFIVIASLGEKNKLCTSKDNIE